VSSTEHSVSVCPKCFALDGDFCDEHKPKAPAQSYSLTSNQRLQDAEHLLRHARTKLASDWPGDQYLLKIIDQWLDDSAAETTAPQATVTAPDVREILICAEGGLLTSDPKTRALALEAVQRALGGWPAQKAAPRCHCHRYEWDMHWSQVESSDGSLHYRNEPCSSEKTPVARPHVDQRVAGCNCLGCIAL